MSTGYPNLFPAGFIEYQDNCSGPQLYRNQYSRESYGPTLNDFMNKYVTKSMTDFNFITMLTYLKYFTKYWEKLPKETQKEILNLLLRSKTGIAKDLRDEIKANDPTKTKKENFGDINSDLNNSKKSNAMSKEEAIEEVNDIISEYKQTNDNYKDVKVIESNNRASIFVISIVAIIALVIGFLIACVQ